MSWRRICVCCLFTKGKNKEWHRMYGYLSTKHFIELAHFTQRYIITHCVYSTSFTQFHGTGKSMSLCACVAEMNLVNKLKKSTSFFRKWIYFLIFIRFFRKINLLPLHSSLNVTEFDTWTVPLSYARPSKTLKLATVDYSFLFGFLSLDVWTLCTSIDRTFQNKNLCSGPGSSSEPNSKCG